MEKKRNYIVTTDVLDPAEWIEHVIRPEAGAINTFIGTVRELTKGKRTLSLTYEAYVPMAEKKLAQIGAEIEEHYEGSRVAIAHRIGRLDISDIAVVIAVSSPHRDESYQGSRCAIERIKEIVPIWKKEHWDDGSEWIGDQLEKVSYADKVKKEEEQ
ncbi:molybdenum cofactor biosynthesis protein MoaE [Alkalicoccus halolimnae]|uniref:Molybdopterin synthase catalytic subunit n=1 Tax=Alkalicoccus halolimnae TaxID=1667239 RepID=A0A5C7F5G2_9BACI|nr:molybdenum cofactor biosynthesis protein MoaE [Alkalicoccus halolimnae]TXF85931.1 molybdenum cofactor biosynthesis protein MoaE [Alkalicoccus halolimnae]